MSQTGNFEDILGRLSARDQLVAMFATAALVGTASDARTVTEGRYMSVVEDAIGIGEVMADQLMERAAANTDEAGDGA